MDNDEIEIVYSPLQQSYTKDDHTLDIQIYRSAHEAGWLLEVVDEGGSSNVWEDLFPTDKAALDEALRTIDEEGVDSFLTKTLPDEAR